MNTLGPYLLGPNDENQGVYTGDALELAMELPPQSIDLIFTDPPYPYEYIDTFSKLSRLAKHCLKPDGLLLCYSGQTHLPEVIQRLGEHLTYRWTIAIFFRGKTQVVWGPRAVASWKPILVYTPSGTPKDAVIFHDTFISGYRDKEYHEWGQCIAEAIKYIDFLTPPTATILDPFCGGGTTPAACHTLGRRYLAFELDPATTTIARQRLRTMQPPLFATLPQQPPLL